MCVSDAPLKPVLVSMGNNVRKKRPSKLWGTFLSSPFIRFIKGTAGLYKLLEFGIFDLIFFKGFFFLFAFLGNT